MLPCNVILRAVDGGVEVSAVDPQASMAGIDNDELKAVARPGQGHARGRGRGDLRARPADGVRPVQPEDQGEVAPGPALSPIRWRIGEVSPGGPAPPPDPLEDWRGVAWGASPTSNPLEDWRGVAWGASPPDPPR